MIYVTCLKIVYNNLKKGFYEMFFLRSQLQSCTQCKGRQWHLNIHSNNDNNNNNNNNVKIYVR